MLLGLSKVRGVRSWKKIYIYIYDYLPTITVLFLRSLLWRASIEGIVPDIER
jgi:hypothetical protein